MHLINADSLRWLDTFHYGPTRKETNMDFSESFKSRLVWANILSIASVIRLKFGIELTAEQQADALTALLVLSKPCGGPSLGMGDERVQNASRWSDFDWEDIAGTRRSVRE
jgi:hypothetical protein